MNQSTPDMSNNISSLPDGADQTLASDQLRDDIRKVMINPNIGGLVELNAIVKLCSREVLKVRKDEALRLQESVEDAFEYETDFWTQVFNDRIAALSTELEQLGGTK